MNMSSLAQMLGPLMLSLVPWSSPEQPLPSESELRAIVSTTVPSEQKSKVAEFLSLLHRAMGEPEEAKLLVQELPKQLPGKVAFPAEEFFTVRPNEIKHTVSANTSSFVMKTTLGLVKFFVQLASSQDRMNPDNITTITLSKVDNSCLPLGLVKSKDQTKSNWGSAIKFYIDHLQAVEPTSTV